MAGFAPRTGWANRAPCAVEKQSCVSVTISNRKVVSTHRCLSLVWTIRKNTNSRADSTPSAKTERSAAVRLTSRISDPRPKRLGLWRRIGNAPRAEGMESSTGHRSPDSLAMLCATAATAQATTENRSRVLTQTSDTPPHHDYRISNDERWRGCLQGFVRR